MKKITITGKPTARGTPTSPDEWVTANPSTPGEMREAGEPTKRLTIDIPLSLHQRVKSQCALKGEKMADVVRELLEEHFSPDEPATPATTDPTQSSS